MLPNQELFDRFPDVAGLTLIHTSKKYPSRKVYLLNNSVIKVKIKAEDTSQYKRQNDFQAEFNILKKCEPVRGIPKAIDFYENQLYQFLILEYIQGTTISDKNPSFAAFMKVLFKLSKILFSLSGRGISHNDIKPDNIICDNSNKVYLVDFDQATITKPYRAVINHFFGFSRKENAVNLSIIVLIKSYLSSNFPKLYLFFGNLLTKGHKSQLKELPNITEDDDIKLQQLLSAWKKAQMSNASSPGKLVAYYSFEYEGITFPGERPWKERWDNLKSVTNYSNKRIIELGCNMGLLSSHLLKFSNAENVIGVDNHSDVINAASLISEVLEVKPQFEIIDFDSETKWEEKLLSFSADIIFALNVFNWIENKERFLQFLSNFSELIYEGHDKIDVETDRIKSIGFNIVKLITYSERGRCLLHCKK